ncbi:MAG: hypothetical protein KGL69_13125 [Alphaproteobacteria bacterium]|nr:hypothetical protein [Alphaproteobacteria bacterium]
MTTRSHRRRTRALLTGVSAFGLMSLTLGSLTALPSLALPSLALAADAASQPVSPSSYDEMHWRLVGPFRGGWATMAVGSPTQPDTFYFGAAGGGVWRTDDAGRTWRSLFDKGGAASIGALAVAPSDPDTLYVGTGQPEPRYDVTAGEGVYKSTDGGKTWTSIGLAATKYIGRIWVDPRHADTLLVGAQGHFFGPSPARGVFRSTDGGKTWTQTLKIDDWTGVEDIASDPQNPDLIFAAAWQVRQYPWQSYFTPAEGPGSAIYVSRDGGVTWSKLSGGGWPEGPLGRIGLAVTRLADGQTRIYATIDSHTHGGLWRSDDGGAHWSRVNPERAFTSYYASRITVAPDDPDTLYTVGQSIRRCTKGGTSCTIIRGSPGGDDYHFIWINPLHPDHIITGSDQGAAVSVDGWRTWSSWYNQPTGQFYHLAADNAFPYKIYSGQQDSGTVGIASRGDYGGPGLREWRPVGGDERDFDIPDPSDPEIVYSSGLGGRVSRFDARTGDVSDISPWPVSTYGQRPNKTPHHFNWVMPLVVSRTGPATLYAGGEVLFASPDGGRSWTTISGDLVGKTANATNCDGQPDADEAKACGYGTITAIEPSPRHAEEIWVGTDDGLIQLTRDGGAHWSNITPPGIKPWTRIDSVDVSNLADGVAYVASDAQRLDDFAPHVWRTSDYGATWTEAVAGLPQGHFISVVRADPKKAGLLYAGSDETAYVSFDNGDHWSSLRQNLPTAWIRDLLVHGDDLIAATQGRAIWVLDDLTALRQVTPALADAQVTLLDPAPALRWRGDNNKDTPPAPETPLGENPPDGAVIDYVLGPNVKGPVTLEIRDASGALVRRFSSNAAPDPAKGNVYFQSDWVRPEPTLSASPGAHRFVWGLRYPRPLAVHYDYSMGITWREGTYVTPQGPMVLPGRYSVTLTADGAARTAPLEVTMDPRVNVPLADLQAGLAYSRKIDEALATTWRGAGETGPVRKALEALDARLKSSKTAALARQAHDLEARIGEASAPDSFETLDSRLVYLETAAEGADAAPTAPQKAVLDQTLAQLAARQTRWSEIKTADLPRLNAALAKAGMAPITPPTDHDLKPQDDDDGDDLH